MSRQINKDNVQLDKFYKKEILGLLDSIKVLVKADKVPKGSVLSLQEFVTNWNMVKRELKDKSKRDQFKIIQEKIRIKGSRADRRSGKSVKLEGKVSKSKAKTKEVRSSKKIANVRKTNRR